MNPAVELQVRETVRELLGRKFNPGQPRDEDGRWSDGMPGSIVSRTMRLAGGTGTIDRQPGANPRLTIGDRTVELSAGGRGSDLERFRSLAIDAQYGDASAAGSDGVFRLARRTTTDDGGLHTEILMSLRPVPGRYVDEEGRPVTDLSIDTGGEVYNAEYDLVLNEGADSDFNDEPMTRVSLADIDPSSSRGIYETMGDAAAAERVDGGLGPVDVFVPKPGRVGFRAKGDDGKPVEVEFNAKDLRRIDAAIDHLVEEGGTRTVETASGPVEITFKGPIGDSYSDDNTLIVSPPSGGPWSFGATGSGIGDLLGAFSANGAAAGIFR